MLESQLFDLHNSIGGKIGLPRPEIFFDEGNINSIFFKCIGLSGSISGVEMVGAAVSTVDFPLERAYFEWFERASIVLAEFEGRLEEPRKSAGLWQYARSNGVAAAKNFTQAAYAATLELEERDRILRSWYGSATRPVKVRRLGVKESSIAKALENYYDCETVIFEEGVEGQEDVAVAGFFGFPKSMDKPIFFGFGAGSLPMAIEKARSEALQRLVFLWGEKIPEVEPALDVSALSQQEFFLYPGNHEKLRAWTRGAHDDFSYLTEVSEDTVDQVLDLTPKNLRQDISIVKVNRAGYYPMAFGPSYPFLKRETPKEIRTHPIP